MATRSLKRGTIRGEGTFPRDDRNSDQQDAYATAEWLCRSDQDRSLERLFSPSLTVHERKVAEIEGWIVGIACILVPLRL